VIDYSKSPVPAPQEFDVKKAAEVLDEIERDLGMVRVKSEGETKHGHPKFHELLSEIGDLHNKKNFDYADGGQQGPLGNFNRISSITRLYPPTPEWGSPTGVALTYMLKQLDAALMMFTTQKVSKTGENLGERLRDVGVYALLAIILSEEKGGA
jgi:hypothetical protein